MSAEIYFKNNINYGRKNINQELDWVFKFAEDYAKHVIETEREFQSNSEEELDFSCEDDDEMGEPCDSDLYCSCGEEIENIGDTICIDCFNEMTYPE